MTQEGVGPPDLVLVPEGSLMAFASGGSAAVKFNCHCIGEGQGD